MPDYDVIIVGGGPAGLAAGLQIQRADLRALVLERELFGGSLQHAARIDDYAAYPDGVTGAQLAAEMIEQATAAGVVLEQGEMRAVELFSRSRFVACSDGRGFSCTVVILACGTRYQSLGLPNESRLRGRGVIDCTPCDGGFFVGKPVTVYGANDYAIQDAVYLANLGARVTLLAPDPDVRPIPGVEVRAGVELSGITGEEGVDAVVCTDMTTRAQQTLPARGVAIRIGSVPNTDDLKDVVDCDADGYVVTDAELATSADFVLACGDVRSGAPGGVAAAVEEGSRVAARAVVLCRG